MSDTFFTQGLAGVKNWILCAEKIIVSVTYFDRVPKTLFLSRMALPVLGVFLLGFLVMGAVATSDAFRSANRRPTALIDGPPVLVYGPPYLAAKRQVEQFFHYMAHMPQVCVTGRTVNDFQTQQCSVFWDDFLDALLMMIIPFFFAGLFIMVGLEQLGSRYKKARKVILKGQALFAGTVTQPPEAPNDVFGKVYCMRTIGIELKNRQQLTVYMPIDAPIPRAGDTLAVFDGGSAFGAKRHIGVLYTPHVAVVAGSR